VNTYDRTVSRDAGRLLRVASPVGIVGPLRQIVTRHWAPAELVMYTAFTGQLPPPPDPGASPGRTFSGCGRSVGDHTHARLVTIAEALERYSAAVYDARCFVRASAESMGSRAIDLRHIPSCSRREYARPGCPVIPADPAAQLRWNLATNLRTGDEVLVPAVMTYLMLDRTEAEKFWMPITTGSAIHFDPLEAVFNAITEVIERDAVSLTWLQKLPLPLLADECIPEAARSLLEWTAERHIETYLFDATTDLGIPTVYCLQVAPHAARGAHLVGGACDIQVERAVTKALLECVGTRAMLHERPPPPRRYRDHHSESDSAATVGRPSARRAFEFLVNGAQERPRSRPRCEQAETPQARVDLVLERLARLRMDAYLTDITPGEVRELGLTAYRVVIPALQPMSLHPLARFTGHQRLFTAPARMGFPVLPESRLNRWPQPMT
jgi:ribosomal protein S12 methylthiotransferase accessory factor